MYPVVDLEETVEIIKKNVSFFLIPLHLIETSQKTKIVYEQNTNNNKKKCTNQ